MQLVMLEDKTLAYVGVYDEMGHFVQCNPCYVFELRTEQNMAEMYCSLTLAFETVVVLGGQTAPTLLPG